MSLLQRLHNFLTKSLVEPGVASLYNACVSQARSPVFYRDFMVPDTLDGRFDLLLLHIFMVMQKLEPAPRIKQQLFDLMFDDMDRSLREMGVGDMSVGKKIRPMISAFYGRGQAYQKALGESAQELAATLTRNLYGNVAADPTKASAMALYVRNVVAQLQLQPLKALCEGQVHFPAPAL